MAEDVKPFLAALRGQSMVPPPLWLMRQAGRYLPEYRKLRERARNFLDFCYTPELAVEATLQPLRRFRPDAAILFSDILVVPDALGQAVDFREGEGPVLEPLRSRRDVEVLKSGRVLRHLEPVFTALRGIRRALPPETALIGFAGAPWTVATYMVEGRGGTDFGRALGWDGEDPEGFAMLIDLLVEATAAYLIEQVRHGAEALQIFDSWAGALDEARFRRLAIAPTRRLVAKVRAACPEIPIIGFPRGAGVLYADYVRETGVDGISLDSAVDLGFARLALQPNTVLQGNLDPQVLVRGGSEMRDAALAILENLGRGPFIFNLGHGVVPETPVENVLQLAATVRAWRP
ncbi:uroporphyrinogen decarboxylase [Shumkonia mesophila]|uniref:uroporphyrinogen decarboxylase n=1 Tax=Shumkonia mesophila TaxID=2838854 RepID=UPI002934ADC3|nr:uroporphyrinogen decarboxylase [Shumkonia mesophila]